MKFCFSRQKLHRSPARRTFRVRALVAALDVEATPVALGSSRGARVQVPVLSRHLFNHARTSELSPRNFFAMTIHGHVAFWEGRSNRARAQNEANDQPLESS